MNNQIHTMPYSHNFRGACGRLDQCSIKAWLNKNVSSQCLVALSFSTLSFWTISVHYLRWCMPLSCINAEACLTGWPNAWVCRDVEVS